MSLEEYYRRLELPGTASPADVKRAYRRLRAKYHPDHNKGREKTVEPAFKRIQEAFEILTGKRKPPEPSPAAASAAGRGKDASSRERRSPPMRGANYLIELFVPAEVAIHGGEVEASYPVTGPHNQTGKVTIPAGAWDGQRLVVEGRGHSGPSGGPRGDAIFTVVIVCGPAFRRNGLNLTCETQVDFVTAMLGGNIEAQVLGRALQVPIPPNTHAGSTIRLPQQGLADRNGARGDLTLQLVLVMPAGASYLTDGERERIREMFADAERRAMKAIPARSQVQS
ncbi:J domain-containing protein [Trinickia terrae]|uniref:J domain-containing protein n=1 Tax=Trinickia terrae TaxID=2571161 RepID=A0A4U1I3R1_9BURK|nr:DnaJ C-terminal domain-containing protein [Trinickia terrae]TKC87878.1 J domain-containing protein [Trinickia terrae]